MEVSSHLINNGSKYFLFQSWENPGYFTDPPKDLNFNLQTAEHEHIHC